MLQKGFCFLLLIKFLESISSSLQMSREKIISTRIATIFQKKALSNFLLGKVCHQKKSLPAQILSEKDTVFCEPFRKAMSPNSFLPHSKRFCKNCYPHRS